MVQRLPLLVDLVVLVVEVEIKDHLELLDQAERQLVLPVEQQTVLLQHQDGEIMEEQEVQFLTLVVVAVAEQALLELLELDHILLVLVDLVEMVSHTPLLE
jgi:hypothetical protein